MTGIAATLLAGGLARRMGGGDKALVPLAGRPLLAHCVERLSSQAAPLVLSANGDPARFAAFALPVVADTVPDRPGPLAGLLAGLAWLATEAPHITHALSLPCDTPFLPRDLVKRLDAARLGAGADVAVAASAGRRHHAVALWPVALQGALRDALMRDGERSVRRFAAHTTSVAVEWAVQPIDPFVNVNTPEDLATCETLLALAD